MAFRCSQCHHESDSDELERCPECGAEAGLEPVGGIPGPMKLFGLLLAGVIVAAIAGGLMSRMAG